MGGCGCGSRWDTGGGRLSHLERCGPPKRGGGVLYGVSCSLPKVLDLQGSVTSSTKHVNMRLVFCTLMRLMQWASQEDQGVYLLGEIRVCSYWGRSGCALIGRDQGVLLLGEFSVCTYPIVAYRLSGKYRSPCTNGELFYLQC